MNFSIIIVHFKGEGHLSKCLSSIPEHPSISELIVVDNGSSEGPLTSAQGIRDDLILITNKKNLGFGGAVNEASDSATGDILLIMNQDIEWHKDTLDDLNDDILNATPGTIFGVQLENADGSAQGSAGPFPTLLNWFSGLLRKRSNRKYYRKALAAGQPVDWVTGAFLAIPRNLFEGLHGFDEGFFMYYEDVDLCKRAAGQGASIGISQAKAIHSAPIAIRSGISIGLLRSIRQSQLRYFLKHRPYWEFGILLLATRTYYILKGWKWEPKYL